MVRPRACFTTGQALLGLQHRAGWPKARTADQLSSLGVVISSRQEDIAAPVSAIFYMVAAYFLFSFLDTSIKYLAVAGIAPLFIAWTRFAGHAVLVPALFRGWRDPARFRAVSPMAHIVRGAFL